MFCRQEQSRIRILVNLKISTAPLRAYQNCTQLRSVVSEKQRDQVHPALPELIKHLLLFGLQFMIRTPPRQSLQLIATQRVLAE